MPVVFVAGATGYTGREVVRGSCRRGLPTFAHVRSDSPTGERWHSLFTSMGAEVDRTPWAPGALRETMVRLQPDIVFSLIGTTRKRAKRAGLDAAVAYETIDYGLTVMLLRAVTDAVSGARFVYLSAMGAGSVANAYMNARARAENVIMSSGVAYTIVRPSMISGVGRDEHRPLERLAAVVVDVGLAIGAALGARRARDRYGSMDNVELADGLVRVALDSAYVDRIVEPQDLRACP